MLNTRTTPRTPNRRQGCRRSEVGAIAVVSIILLPLFVGLALFMVDLSFMVLQDNEVQQAADAAALAGVVALPARPAEAEAIADRLARSNAHISDGNGEVTLDVPTDSNRLKVTISRRYQSLFASFFGFTPRSTIRSATAEFNPPIAMGSPFAALGSDPTATTSSTTNYFLHSQSLGAPKGHGDRYGSESCDPVIGHTWAVSSTGAAGPSTTSGCTSNDFNGNAEYHPEKGYVYYVDVPPAPAGGYTSDLTIEAFDPIFVHQGGQCSQTPILTTAQISTLVGLGFADAATRYQPRTAIGPTKWCTGDQILDTTDPAVDSDGRSDAWDDGGPPLTFSVYNPSDRTPGDDFDGGYTGLTVASCRARSFDGFYNSHQVTGKPYTGTPFELLARSRSSAPDAASVAFAEGYERWVTVCTVPRNQLAAGRYMLEIRSDLRVASSPMVTAVTGRPPLVPTGRFSTGNHFSLRASIGADGPVKVSAKTRLSIFVNTANSDPTVLYVARILPLLAGSRVNLELFDIGDAAADTSLSVLPPSDATIDTGTGPTPLAQFPTCAVAKDLPGATEETSDHTPCGPMQFNRLNDDARTTRITVDLPDSYSCASGTLTGCWLRIRMDPSGPDVHDATTWTLTRNGSPVRIVSRKR